MRLVSVLTPVLFPFALVAQQQVTRADAVAAALARGARVALARADTTAALGAARAARAFPNPTVSGSYTKDTPNYHALADLPLDLPWLGPRRRALSFRLRARRDPVRRRYDLHAQPGSGAARALIPPHRPRCRQSVADRRAAAGGRRRERARRPARGGECGAAREHRRRRLARRARNALVAATADGAQRQRADDRVGRFAAPTTRPSPRPRRRCAPPSGRWHSRAAAASRRISNSASTPVIRRVRHRISCCPSSAFRSPSRSSTLAAATCCVRLRSGIGPAPSST